MPVELARDLGPGRITIAYERFGDPSAPPVLLIMGIGAQMLLWADGFCEALVARGLHVIRFDNRDVGLSTHLHDARVPDFAAALAGDLSSVSYTLSDMAADTAGLLDALGLAGAHIVGASMGGFIAQTLAIEHPARVRSLTSIMSTTGARTVGQPQPVAMQIFAGPTPTTREQAIERAQFAARIIGSPAHAPDLAAIATRAGLAYDRGYDPLGIVRQAVAVIASGDRTERLRTVSVPTLVIHGTADVLVDPSGGHATAAAIPGAELVLLEGMGHDLPRALWPELVARIASHIDQVGRGPRS
jgi:pimeloyl-ACP methyl ester carboxylesterase